MILDDGTRVLVKELTEHRVALVLQGSGMSSSLSGTDPGTACEGEPLQIPSSYDKADLKSAKTATNLWEFTQNNDLIVFLRYCEFAISKVPSKFTLCSSDGDIAIAK